jgi:ribose 5-phosphate isomerase B
MKIAIGADHRGFVLKQFIMSQFPHIKWIDVGAFSQERSDYPVFACNVVHELMQDNASLGIMLCGTGIGMAVAANRFKNMYAALAWNETVARQSREHDGANILVLPADFISSDQATSMIDVWINAQFLGGRYQKRIDMIDKLGR